jgi:hypothetical protein
MLRKALVRTSVPIGALLLGNIDGCSFLRAFEIKRHIKRYVKMPCKQVSLSIGAPMGNLDGIHLPGPFERKGKYIWVPFSDLEEINILSLEAIWNIGKGTGLYRADIRLWGTKGLSIRPRCIGTIRARAQCLINQSLLSGKVNNPHRAKS